MTCGCYTEEFSLDCNITDVQAYFNVSGGGLLLNGMGPVVRRVYDGCAYELRGRCNIQVAPWIRPASTAPRDPSRRLTLPRCQRSSPEDFRAP